MAIESSTEAYLWIKITPLRGEQPAEPAAGPGANETQVKAVFKQLAHLEGVNARTLCLTTECTPRSDVGTRGGGRPPMVPGGQINGIDVSWLLDRDFNGTRGSGTAVDMYAVEGGRKAALAWLASTAGQAWCQGAITYFLVVLTPAVACADGNPDDDWTKLEACLGKRVTEVMTAVDSRWLDKPTALPPQACQDLQDKAGMRAMPAVANAILAQDRWEQDALWPVQRLIGGLDQPPRVVTKLMVGLLMDCMRLAHFHFKGAYRKDRKRPYEAGGCAGLTVMPGVVRPWHPTYPGGHAAMAYALAAVYGHMFPALTAALDAAAAGVAQNREIAGLHYADDSAAGQTLAKAVVGMLLSGEGAGPFGKLVSAAQAEW